MKLKQVILSLLSIFLVLGLVLPVFSMYIGNYSEKGFVEGSDEGQSVTTNSTSLSIKDLIIKSATYFLKGKSHVDLLSSRLEAAEHDGICFYDYQIIVNDALDNMRAARYYYKALKDKAESTPYNGVVINQLLDFNYDSFEAEYGLNRDIFNQVKSYLQAGDIRGAYARLYADTDSIIKILETVQRDVYYWWFPDKADIWKLNQECANMHLFGQYMAQVFYSVQ